MREKFSQRYRNRCFSSLCLSALGFDSRRVVVCNFKIAGKILHIVWALACKTSVSVAHVTLCSNDLRLKFSVPQ